MKNFLLWLLFSTFGLAQTLPWTGNSTDAWLKQSPNALVLPKAGTYIKLSGQTNRLSISSDQLLLDGNPIGGTTIYTGDGTLPSDRFVDGDGHLMSFFGNDLFLAESASGSTLQGGTNLIAIAPAGIEFRTPGLPAATSGQILTLSGGLVDYFDVVGSSGGQTNWGLVVRDPSDGTAKNTGVTIGDIITGGGPGGTNQNFANTDLTFTGSRTHDADGNSLIINNTGATDIYTSGGSFFSLSDVTTQISTIGGITINSTSGTAIGLNGGNDTIFVRPNDITLDIQNSGDEIRFYSSQVYDGNAVNGQVWTLLDSSTGKGDWSDPPAGPNFANADLTFTGNRTHDANTNGLSIINVGGGGFNVVDTGGGSFQQSGGSFSIIADSAGSAAMINGGISLGVYSFGVEIYSQACIDNQVSSGMVFTTTDVFGDGEWLPLPFPLNGVPTVAAGAGAGGSPTVTLANETDSAFTLNVTAGTSPATDDDIAVISFATTNYVTAPHFSLSPGNKPAATLSGASQVWATTTTTNLTLHSNATGLTATTNYVWEILVVR